MKESFANNWYEYVAEQRRTALVEILAEVSRLFRLNSPQFMLVGACSLLIRGSLQYKAWWDVDLLFQSIDDIHRFHKLSKGEQIRIFPVDEKPVNYEYLSSMQTMWAYQNVWYRVDYIFKEDFYQFHCHTPDNSSLYDVEISLNEKLYHITLDVAHPWNIFIEKLLSPRLEFELKAQDGYSIDIRHVFILYEQYKKNSEFWSYLSQKSSELGKSEKFKHNFESLLQARKELGYNAIVVSKADLKKVHLL